MIKYFICIASLTFSFFTSPLTAQQWVPVNPALGAVADLFELDGNLYTISNLGLFGYSQDDGASWEIEDIYDVVTLPNGITTCIAFFDPENGLIGIRDVQLGNQLLRTTDGPFNWEVSTPVYDENCSTGFIPINFFRVNDSILILDGLQTANYRITYDRGLSWECSNNFTGAGGIQVLEVRSDSEWLLNDSRGLHKTTDGGQSWTTIFGKELIHYQQLNEQTLYGLTPYFDEPGRVPVLYQTTDDFQTYDSIALNQFAGMFLELFVAVSENQYYVLANGTDIYYSTDGGVNFTFLQTLSNQPFKASHINGDWYLFGRGLWKLDENLTSVKPELAFNEVRVFPNPALNTLYIEDNSFTAFELISANGTFLHSGIIENSKIDLSRLVSGLYFLKLKRDDLFTIQKVIKL